MKTLKDYLAETIRRYGAVGSSPGMGYTVEDAAVKYGVFAKGGSVGSQRFRDDPLKTFDTKEEAIADARRRRSGLSKGERGYYRMSYIVKPIKGVSEGPDKGWVPNPDNPGYYIHRSDLPQTGKVSDPAKAKLSRIINKYFGQIYDYGDGDESLNYLDNNAPLWFDLFDKHDGDIDAIKRTAID